MKLIHYGSKKFDPTDFNEIRNNYVKPCGGLWTSPIDSEWGWKQWCKAEDFRECNDKDSFIITLQPNTRILTIDSVDDLELLKWRPFHHMLFPDYEEAATRYNAIHLTERGQNATRFSNPKNLYGWDCESVLILTKEVIL